MSITPEMFIPPTSKTYYLRLDASLMVLADSRLDLRSLLEKQAEAEFHRTAKEQGGLEVKGFKLAHTIPIMDGRDADPNLYPVDWCVEEYRDRGRPRKPFRVNFWEWRYPEPPKLPEVFKFIYTCEMVKHHMVARWIDV